MNPYRALLPVALAVALSISPRVNAGSFTFSDGNFTNYTWTATDIQDTTAGKTASFNAGEAPTGAYNGGPYRSNSFRFSYNGTQTNQGIMIGNLSTNLIYSPAVSGAISNISAFSIAGNSTFSGGSPAIFIGLLLMQSNVLLQTNIYYTDLFSGVAGLDVPIKDQSPQFASSFTRVGSSGPLYPDFSTNGEPVEFGYVTSASLSSGTSPAVITGAVGADYFALSISNTPSMPQFTSQQPVNATNLLVTLSGLYPGESITWLVSTNLDNSAVWASNSTTSAMGTNGSFIVTNSIFPAAPSWFLRAQVQ